MIEKDNYVVRWKQAAQRPSGLVDKTKGFLRHGFLSTLSHVTPQKDGNFLRCLFCHYVFDDQKDKFEKIIRALNEKGTFVDTDKCIKMIEGKLPIDGRYFHLSIDDGFRNVIQNAIPVLKKFEIPAIIFVPTALIGAGYEAAKYYCLKTTNYRGVVELLNWDELRTIASWGYEVGSHTRTHARFSEISKTNMLEDEIYGSKSDLEKQLGTECKYISWPYGLRGDADSASLDMTRRAGYRACFGAYRGTATQNETNLYSVPRHHFEVEWPLSHIRYFAGGNMESR